MAVNCPKCETDNIDTAKFCSECATPLQLSKDISVTKTIETPTEELTRGSIFSGRYEIIEKLGAGGMGKVYRVEDTKAKEEIALKLIKSEIVTDKKTIERFRTELTTARKIRHKNICGMFDLGEDKGSYYITMEYVPGEDLKSLIRRVKIDTGAAVKIAKQVCEGLSEAHRLGVIHRDLKPSNIMIDKEGSARIMDFGIARTVKGKGITGAGVMIGTPEYMSPEQVEAKKIDQRSDIYSLGVILYEMTTGRLPFDGDTALSIAMKHKSESPRNPKEHNAQIPDVLNHIIMKCLEKDKELRYQNVDELRADLSSIKEGISPADKEISKRKPLTSKEITVSFNVKKLFIPALSLVFLIIVVLAILQLFPKKSLEYSSKIENSIAIISFNNRTGDEAFDHLQNVIPNFLITNIENYGEYYVPTWERMRDLLKKIGKKNVEFINSEAGFEICRMEGVEAIITGEYTKAGDVFALNVKVLDVETKKSIHSANSRGKGEASILQTQIDDLSRKIARGIGMGMSKGDVDRLSITDVTTDSIEAYNYFLKGREAYEKSYLVDARQYFEKAVEKDPDFASPYLHLVWLYDLRGEQENLRSVLTKAKSLVNRTAEKEKLYIEAMYAGFIENDSEKFILLLRQIASQYPREKIIYHHLGDNHFLNGRLHDAIGEYLKGLELDPEFGMLLFHVALSYLLLEDTDRAMEYLYRHEAAAPDDAVVPYLWGGVYLVLGKYDEALSKFKESLEIKPDYLWSIPYVPFTHAMKEEYSEAFSWINQYMNRFVDPWFKVYGYLWRSVFYYWLGDMNSALNDINKAEELIKDIEVVGERLLLKWIKFVIYYTKGEYALARIHLENLRDILENNPISRPKWKYSNYFSALGLLDLKEGKIDQAEVRKSEAKSLEPEIWFHGIYSYQQLQREIWLAKTNFDDIIAEKQRITPFIFTHGALRWVVFNSLPFIGDAKARAYNKKGDFEEAIEEYEKLIGAKPDQVNSWLIHPLYYYRLAKLYEQSGRPAEAMEHYEKFLDLWKDADPGIADVEDAKQRLLGLKGN